MDMEETGIVTARYQVPTYKLEPQEAWFHFLHGNVPGHQIDFMVRPVVPQSPLTRQHFSHLERVVKYIEPRHAAAYSFAITNLSRDDSQHEPGHGGIAFIFGLRIKGARDHAGRQDPPFCHSAVLIDRHLDAQTLYGVAAQFYKKLLPDQESQVEGGGWYHLYVQHAENPERAETVLKTYLQDFADLYVPPPSRQGLRWTAEGVTVPRRVTIVYPDRADFLTISYGMARIAEVLIESDVKWTAISNGREQDIPGGLTVRFVPMREATGAAADEALLYLEQLPEDAASIALQLFNAREVTQHARMSRLPPAPVMAAQNQARPGGPHEYANPNGPTAATGAYEDRVRPWETREPEPAPAPAPEAPMAQSQGLGIVDVVEKKDSGEPPLSSTDWASEYKKNERKQRKQTATALAATAAFILVFGGLAVLWVTSAPDDPNKKTESTAPPAPKSAAVATSPPPPATTAVPAIATAAESTTAAANAPFVAASAMNGTITPPALTIKTTTTKPATKTPTKSSKSNNSLYQTF